MVIPGRVWLRGPRSEPVWDRCTILPKKLIRRQPWRRILKSSLPANSLMPFGRDARGLKEGDSPPPGVLARDMVGLHAASKVELRTGSRAGRRHEFLTRETWPAPGYT